MIILGTILGIIISIYWFTFVIPIIPWFRHTKHSTPQKGWQFLGEIYSLSIILRGRNPNIIPQGSNPKILEWVRKEIGKRSSELQHWNDSIFIKGSYYEYRVQLQENFVAGTHEDDKIFVWRKRI